MTILNYLRKLIKRNSPKPSLEYVHESGNQSSSLVPAASQLAEDWEMGGEIDLTSETNLENYARELNVSKKSIERWISSGLLMPEELRIAEKLVKLMNKG